MLALVREAIVENQVKAESKHINLVLSLNGKHYMVETATEDGSKGTVCKIAIIN